MGKILEVNLSTRTIKKTPLNVNIAKNLFGGSGYGAWILHDEMPNPSQVDPIGPENPLIIMSGPLTGTLLPGGARAVAVAKSPLTGIFGEACTGGHFPSEMKFAGFDGTILLGRASSPMLLSIIDGEARLADAKHLWGLDAYETIETVPKELGDRRIKVACIGSAGERLAKLACIMNDDGRTFGRTGLGAVMGSKNLKAIAVRGSRKVLIADEKEFMDCVREHREKAKESSRAQGLKKDGTSMSVETFEHIGNLPTKYWTKGIFEGAAKISGSTMTKSILSKTVACYACPIGCGRYIELKEGPYAGLRGPGPEYETIAAFGSLCLNDNLESIAKANDLCNRYGLDTISAGSTIAFAMECYEKGLITKKETIGVELTWGNHEAIVKMVELMGRKEGFGAILADGVKEASRRIGKGSEKFAMHVKGLEVPMHEPRRHKSMGLGYATSNRGACHLQGTPMFIERGMLMPEYGLKKKMDGFSIERKPEITTLYQDLGAAFNALGVCIFTIFDITPVDLIARAYTALTGHGIDKTSLRETGERIWNLKRIFNMKCGVTPRDDTLPQRFTGEQLNEGAAKNSVCELEPMMKQYYKLRKWDSSSGKTSKAKLGTLLGKNS